MMFARIKRGDVFPHGFLIQQMSTLPYIGMRLADVMQGDDTRHSCRVNVDQQPLPQDVPFHRHQNQEYVTIHWGTAVAFLPTSFSFSYDLSMLVHIISEMVRMRLSDSRIVNLPKNVQYFFDLKREM
jgi:hypothetical protein